MNPTCCRIRRQTVTAQESGWKKGLFFLKGSRSLFRRNLPHQLEQRRRKPQNRCRQKAARVNKRVSARKKKKKKAPPKEKKQQQKKTKVKTSKTHFLVRLLLRTRWKTAGWKFPQDSWVVALAEKVERPEGSDLRVMVRVSRWSVGRRRRVGFDPPALHVRDELIWDLG